MSSSAASSTPPKKAMVARSCRKPDPPGSGLPGKRLSSRMRVVRSSRRPAVIIARPERPGPAKRGCHGFLRTLADPGDLQRFPGNGRSSLGSRGSGVRSVGLVEPAPAGRRGQASRSATEAAEDEHVLMRPSLMGQNLVHPVLLAAWRPRRPPLSPIARQIDQCDYPDSHCPPLPGLLILRMAKYFSAPSWSRRQLQPIGCSLARPERPPSRRQCLRRGCQSLRPGYLHGWRRRRLLPRTSRHKDPFLPG